MRKRHWVILIVGLVLLNIVGLAALVWHDLAKEGWMPIIAWLVDFHGAERAKTTASDGQVVERLEHALITAESVPQFFEGQRLLTKAKTLTSLGDAYVSQRRLLEARARFEEAVPLWERAVYLAGWPGEVAREQLMHTIHELERLKTSNREAQHVP